MSIEEQANEKRRVGTTSARSPQGAVGMTISLLRKFILSVKKMAVEGERGQSGRPAGKACLARAVSTQCRPSLLIPLGGHRSHSTGAQTSPTIGIKSRKVRDAVGGRVGLGVVSNQVRRWPPASNASGAEVAKNDWLREVTKEQDDGLITTMCRSEFFLVDEGA
ncbi:hypothetical protein OSTOST_04099, partial [Ostertagia ostertagi]